MKKLAIAIAAIALIGTPAFAADMAVKAPPPAPAPVYNWTGWYAGVNAGASFGNVKTDFNAAPATVTLLGFFPQPITEPFTTPGFAGSNQEYPSGFIGGGQIGYNWQFSPTWVAGLEADFQGADEKEHSGPLTQNFSGFVTGFPSIVAPPFVTGTTVLNYATKIEWFGTVRGRIGYVWGDGAVLSYVTGGLAYGRVDLAGTSTVSGSVTIPSNTFSMTRTIGHSQVNAGWVVGGGTEGRLAFWGLPNWTWKIEGLYMDLGTLDDADPFVPGITSVTGGQTFTHTHFTDAIVRAGLNYQFH